MFVGHYATALAAKAIEPRAPLWTLVAGAQLVDIGWSALLMAGVEKVRFDPSLPGSPLDLYYMPFTHSLPAAIAWSVAALLLCRILLKLPMRAAIAVGLVVFSHWALDWLVHRPDLELWFGGDKVGLGLWNYPLQEAMLEMGLIALGGGAWLWSRGAWDRSAWPALLFITFLVGLQIFASMTEPSGPIAAYGRTALIVYLVVVALSALADLGGRKQGQASG
ncbi:MAG: hypothetical protein KF842_08570 [Caulobacter sp.]|nr:hypothetical protein [Caulobacter sp.]